MSMLQPLLYAASDGERRDIPCIMSAPPSEEEVNNISQLKERLADVLEDADEAVRNDDFFILRFLRSNKGKVEGAEKALRRTLAWRKDNGIWRLRNEPLNEFCASSFPVTIEGRDRAGRPVVTVPVGNWDLGKAVNDENFPLFQTYNAQILEKILAQVEQANRERPQGSDPIFQYTVIYDWEGLAMRPVLNVTIDRRLSDITNLIDLHFPEALANCIYINCTMIMSTVLMILKASMSSEAFAKIRNFGKDRNSWVPVILELVDPSQLTQRYGGTKDLVPPPQPVTSQTQQQQQQDDQSQGGTNQ